MAVTAYDIPHFRQFANQLIWIIYEICISRFYSFPQYGTIKSSDYEFNLSLPDWHHFP